VNKLGGNTLVVQVQRNVVSASILLDKPLVLIVTENISIDKINLVFVKTYGLPSDLSANPARTVLVSMK
jgi:hypothetical protein